MHWIQCRFGPEVSLDLPFSFNYFSYGTIVFLIVGIQLSSIEAVIHQCFTFLCSQATYAFLHCSPDTFLLLLCSFCLFLTVISLYGFNPLWLALASHR